MGGLRLRCSMREQRHIHFRGRVQGVGFRYTTRQIAGSFAVTGYVQNLADGRVLVVAEGDAAELDRFVAAIEEAMKGNITGRDVAKKAATGEFKDFSIRH
jgi:acylphosphatase